MAHFGSGTCLETVTAAPSPKLPRLSAGQPRLPQGLTGNGGSERGKLAARLRQWGGQGVRRDWPEIRKIAADGKTENVCVMGKSPSGALLMKENGSAEGERSRVLHWRKFPIIYNATIEITFYAGMLSL